MLPSRYDLGEILHDLLSRVISQEDLTSGKSPRHMVVQNLDILKNMNIAYVHPGDLLFTDTDNNMIGAPISTLLYGQEHQVTIADNGGGTALIGTVQDIDVTSSPTFDSPLFTGSLTVNERLLLVPSLYTGSPASNTCKFEMFGDNLYDTLLNIRRSDNLSYGPGILLQKSKGTLNTPTSVKNSDILGEIFFSGYDGQTPSTNSWPLSAKIMASATEDHNIGSHGTNLKFYTTKNGLTSLRERLIIDHDGVTTITCTTQSGSLTTGSLVVAGGAGISGNMYLGGDMHVTGTVYDPQLNIFGTTDASQLGNGVLTVAGGASILKTLYVGTHVFIGTGRGDRDYQCEINVPDTSGNLLKLTNSGGVDAAGAAEFRMNSDNSMSIYSKNNTVTTKVCSFSTTQLRVDLTNNSTSTSTGSLLVIGGAGVEGTLSASILNADIGKTISTVDSTSPSTGSLIVGGGLGVNSSVFVGGNLTVAYALNAGSLAFTGGTITSLADSTSTSSGALTVYGGVGIGKNITVGGIIKTQSTIDSTSTSTGALIVGGGAGIAKNLFVGEATTTTELVVTNSSNLNASLTTTTNGALYVEALDTVQSQLVADGAIFVCPCHTTIKAGFSPTFVATDPQFTNGNPTIIDGKINLPNNGSTGSSITFSMTTITTSTTFKFKITPEFTTDAYAILTWSIPSGGWGIFERLYSQLALYVHDDVSTVMSINFGNWQPTNGVEYEMELDYDITGIGTRLFIDGIQYGPTTMTVGTHNNSLNLRIGGGIGYPSGYLLRDIVVYNGVQHTANYTPGYGLVGGIEMMQFGYVKTDTLIVRSTIDSTSVTTGSVTIAGGVGIGGNVNALSAVYNSTVNSTSSTTGALQVVGGAGINQIYTGTNINTPIVNVRNSADTLRNKLSTYTDGSLSVSACDLISGTTFIAQFHREIIANYVPPSMNSVPEVIAGTSTIANDRLYIENNDGNSYVRWSNISAIDPLNVGTIKFKYIPTFTNAPADGNANTFIVIRNSSENYRSSFGVWFQSWTSSILVEVFDDNEVPVVDSPYVSWLPVAGTEYSFQINFDFTVSTGNICASLYINNVLHSNYTKTSNNARVDRGYYMYLGTDPIYYTVARTHGYYRDFIIYSTQQPVSSTDCIGGLNLVSGGYIKTDTLTLKNYDEQLKLATLDVNTDGSLGITARDTLDPTLVFIAPFSTTITAVVNPSSYETSPDASSGTATISNGKLTMTNSDASYVAWHTNTFANTFTIKFLYTPNYTGYPTNTQRIFTFGTIGSSPNRYLLEHFTNGYVYSATNNSNGTTGIYNGFSQQWSPVSGTEYEIEIDHDGSSGVSMYVNGVQLGTKILGTCSRNSDQYIQIGTGLDDAATVHVNYSMRNVLIYNTIQHTSGYTPGYTMPTLVGGINMCAGGYIKTDTLIVRSTTDSTSTTTGSVNIIGGVSIAKNLYVGGTLNAGTLTFTGATITSTVNSTGSSSGALTVIGGVGIGKNVNIGSNLFVASNASSNNSYVYSQLFFPLAVTGAIFYGTLASTTNLDYVTNALSVIGTTTGTVTTSGGKTTIASGGSIAYNEYDTGQRGAVKFMFTPSWSGNPSSRQTLFSITGGGSTINTFQDTNGQMYTTFSLYGSDMPLSYTWVPVAGTEYEIEYNWNDTWSGSAAVYITLFFNGIYSGSLILAPRNRVSGTTFTLSALGAYRNVILYNNVQHSPTNPTNYTPGYVLNIMNFSNSNNTLNLSANNNIVQDWNNLTYSSSIYYTSQSTSTSTGALIVGGGLGVAKQLHIGDILTIHNSSDGSKLTTLSTSSDGSIIIQSSGPDINTHALNRLNVISVADSTSIYTGALTVAGGVGIKQGAHIGYQLVVHNSQDTTKTMVQSVDYNGNATITTGTLTLANTTVSTSSTTGALQVVGGAGINQIYVGTNINTPIVNVRNSADTLRNKLSTYTDGSLSVSACDLQTGATFITQLHREIIANYIPPSMNAVPVISGTATITNDRLLIQNPDGNTYVKWSNASVIDPVNTGTVKFKYTPTYSGYSHSGNLETFISFDNGSYSNTFRIYRYPAVGQFCVVAYLSNVAPLTDAYGNSWSVVEGTEYDIQVNFDLTVSSGNACVWVYINGSLHSTIDKVSNDIRPAGAQNCYIGTNGINSDMGAFGYFRDVVIYPTIQPVSSTDCIGGLNLVSGGYVKADTLTLKNYDDQTKTVSLTVDMTQKLNVNNGIVSTNSVIQGKQINGGTWWWINSLQQKTDSYLALKAINKNSATNVFSEIYVNVVNNVSTYDTNYQYRVVDGVDEPRIAVFKRFGVLDYIHEVHGSSNMDFGDNDTHWQSFTVANNAALTFIEVYLSLGTAGGGMGSYTIRIYSGQGTGGTLLTTTTSASSPVGAQWHGTTLPTPVTVTPGTYTLAITSPTIPVGSGFTWKYGSSSNYVSDIAGNVYYFGIQTANIFADVFVYGISDSSSTTFVSIDGTTAVPVWTSGGTGTWPSQFSGGTPLLFDSSTAIPNNTQSIGTLIVNSTIQATNSITGALIISGGTGIAKNLFVGGTLTKAGGSFLIPHPDPAKPDWQLRHCFVESNTRGDNIYRYSTTTSNLTSIIQLPDYFKHINENPQIFITAVDVMGYGRGTINEENTEVTIQVSIDGTYNVLVIGTRKDQIMKDYWDQYGAEIPPN
jgi:enhancing lycopene biosynthesis protein 2